MAANVKENLQEEINTLSKTINGFSKEFESVFRGDDLQILQALMRATSVVASTFTLKEGSGTLLLALYASTMHAENEKSGSGFLSPSLYKLKSSICNASSSFWMKELSFGSLQLFDALVSALLATAGVLGVAIAKKGQRLLPLKEEGEKKGCALFFAELVFNFLVSAEILEEGLTAILNTLGANQKSQEPVISTLTCLFLIFMIQANAGEDNEMAGRLFLNVKKMLLLHLNKISKEIENGEQETRLIDSSLKMMIEALNREDFSSFQAALTSFMTLIDITQEEMQSTLKEVSALQERLAYAFSFGMDDQTNTDTYIISSV